MNKMQISSATLIVTPTHLDLESVPSTGANPVALDIRYSGNIDGELLGNNIIGINRGRMLIVFLEPLESPFMNMSGDFKIKSVDVYSRDGSKVRASIRQENDEMGKIKSEWNTSDSKYEELNQTSRGSRVRKTRVTYTLEGKKVTINEKGKKIRTRK